MTALDCLKKTSREVKSSVSCMVGINGFGRIGKFLPLDSLSIILTILGRNVLRAALARSDVQVAAINHTCTTTDDLLYLIRKTRLLLTGACEAACRS